MVESTLPSLLLRVRDPRDDEAWREFVAVYGPLIYHLARKHGLQDADAADVTQNVLEGVARTIRRLEYDPRQGSFRSWLCAAVRHHVQKFHQRQRKVIPGSGDTGVEAVLAGQPQRDADREAAGERQEQWRLFQVVVGRIRGTFADATWRAFWLTAVEGISTQEVAQRLGLSVGALYTARSRVLNRVRREVQQLQEVC
jgi:RNA polymerase sigma-70 factor (ECF subfamily)